MLKIFMTHPITKLLIPRILIFHTLQKILSFFLVLCVNFMVLQRIKKKEMNPLSQMMVQVFIQY